MRGNGELGEEELLHIVVESTLAFLTREEENNHLDTFVELSFQSLDPVVSTHRGFNLTTLRFSLVVAASVETFFHR